MMLPPPKNQHDTKRSYHVTVTTNTRPPKYHHPQSYHPKWQLPNISCRTFAATSRQKRLQREQQAKTGDGGEKKSAAAKEEESKPKADNTTTTTIMANNNTKKPPANSSSLIRTNFAGQQQQELLLNLPSGYELPSLMDNNSNSSNSQQQHYVDYKELYDPKIHLPSAPQDWSDYEPATPLWEEMAAQIGVVGRPLTVAEFMQQALLHPQFGYYTNRQPRRISQSATDENDNDNDDEDDWDKDDWDMEEEGSSSKDNNNHFNPIFGPRGDFVTAPEICQVFGESIQVWMVTQWEAMGKPEAYQMVEFGPGRGTLMADMVRFGLTYNDKLSEYGKALKVIHFIEGSEALRQQQEATLREQIGESLVNLEFHNPNSNQQHRQENKNDNKSSDTTEQQSTNEKKDPSISTIQVYWHDTFASLSAMIMRQKQQNIYKPSSDIGTNEEDPTKHDVSSMPLFVVCQEFFDALPVHAFEMTEEGCWRERLVDVAIQDEYLEEDDNEAQDGNGKAKPEPKMDSANSKEKRPRLRIVLAPEVTPALKTLMNVDQDGKMLAEVTSDKTVRVGDVAEVCPEGILLVQDIAFMLNQQGGAALVIDYGEEGSTDSLRGFWKHKQTHFLRLPGQVDVTADVDFTALKHAINFSRQGRLDQHQQQPEQQQPGSDNTKPPANNIIKAHGPIPQGKFLVAMGAQERVIQSIESDATTDEQAEDLYLALERLVAPEQMGVKYKVLSITPERKDRGGSFTVPPAGF